MEPNHHRLQLCRVVSALWVKKQRLSAVDGESFYKFRFRQPLYVSVHDSGVSVLSIIDACEQLNVLMHDYGHFRMKIFVGQKSLPALYTYRYT